MKVLATGASGATAGLVVPALVARGIQVRALVHDPAKADVPRAQGADEVVVGDLSQRSSVDEVVRGVDGVFLITPAFHPKATQMGLDVVDAAARAGVSKIVYSGVYHPSLPLVNHAGTRPIEQALYRADLSFTVLQPAMFMQGLAGAWQEALNSGTVTMPWSQHSAMTYVDYRDVAEVVAIAFAGDALDNGTFELAAQGGVDRVRLAALIGKIAGRSVTAADPTDGQPSGMSEGLIAMFHDYDRYGFHGGTTWCCAASCSASRAPWPPTSPS